MKQCFDPILDIRGENNIANQRDRVCAGPEGGWRSLGCNPANRHNRNTNLLTNFLQLLKATGGIAGRLCRCAEQWPKPNIVGALLLCDQRLLDRVG